MSQLNDRTNDWREFATRLEKVSWMRLRRHLNQMPGAHMVDLACDPMTEVALIFTYAGERFAVEVSDGEFQFSVENADAPEQTLKQVCEHVDALFV